VVPRYLMDPGGSEVDKAVVIEDFASSSVLVVTL